MKSINKLRKQLQIGSGEQRRHLDAVLRDRNVPASTIIEAIYEAAMDAERCLRMAKAPQSQIDWTFKLQECADSLMAHLYALDTNAEGEVFLVATRTGFDVSQAAGSNFSLEKAESWLDSASSVLFEALGILSSRGGAEERVSLKHLVEQLCQLWEHETQSPVAAHGILRDVYQSRAVTDAGRFVAAAVEAMLPNESWFAERPAQSMRAMTFLPFDRPARKRQILGIMRDFVRRREWSSKDALPKECTHPARATGQIGFGWDAGESSSGVGGDVLPVPVPGQEFVNAFGGVIWQAGQHVGEPSLRIDTVELGCGDQRVDRSGAPVAVVGAGEGPVLSPESNGPQLAFRRIVRHAKAPIIEEAGEGVPAIETVVDRFCRVAVLREPGALSAQPSLQFDDQWPATLLAHAQALLWHEAVDLALDGEQDIDALDRLGRNRRLVEPRQVKELAPCMRPARSFDDRTSLAVGLVEFCEAGVGVGLH